MIYTTSCRDKNYADLKPLLERLDAQLVDVRFTPAAKPVQWTKAYLGVAIAMEQNHTIFA